MIACVVFPVPGSQIRIAKVKSPSNAPGQQTEQQIAKLEYRDSVDTEELRLVSYPQPRSFSRLCGSARRQDSRARRGARLQPQRMAAQAATDAERA